MRYRHIVLVTGLSLAGVFLYYLGWRSGLKARAAGSGAQPIASRAIEVRPATVEAPIEHEPETGSPAPPSESPAEASAAPAQSAYDVLTRRSLTPPITGLRLQDIQDTFNEGRANGKPHEATDILAPRGTPVLAIEDGTIRKLFTSVPGGLTIYEFDPQGEYCYYYAHLDHYAEGLREGMQVPRGTVIGYVGTTGNAPANTPHLHLAIFKLGPDKVWWKGEAINPYPVLKKLVGESSSR